MRYQLRTEIEIDASPEVVWRHLTDLTAYEDWNPFITSGSGTATLGARLRLRLEPPGGKAMTFRPTVTEVDHGRVFEWLGHAGLPHVFDGRHRFELSPTQAGTRLIQSEAFNGLLVRMMRRSLEGPTRAGFETMNAALARRVLRDLAAA